MMNNMLMYFCGLLLSHTALSQSQRPFELERFEEFKYAEQIYLENPEELEVEDLAAAYFKEYKRQRSENPSEYFIPPTAIREEFKTLIQEKDPSHSANLLIRFLEEGCTEKVFSDLLKAPSEPDVLLAYQFLAAYAKGDEAKEAEYLEEMDQAGFLSPVLKAWGEAALTSASGFSSILTNGLQDLIAIRYGQLIGGMEPDLEIGNRFIQKCLDGREVAAFANMWIAPTVEGNVIAPFAKRMQVVGIGFSMTPQDQSASLEKVVKSMERPKSLTPADRGLVSSYRYLQEALFAIDKSGWAEDLQEYIEKEGLR